MALPSRGLARKAAPSPGAPIPTTPLTGEERLRAGLQKGIDFEAVRATHPPPTRTQHTSLQPSDAAGVAEAKGEANLECLSRGVGEARRVYQVTLLLPSCICPVGSYPS